MTAPLELLTERIAELLASGDTVSPTQYGVRIGDYTVTIVALGGVLVRRRFSVRSATTYACNMTVFELDALVLELSNAPRQLELLALDDVPTPMTAAARWVSPRIVANLMTAIALAGLLLAL